jgi:Tfp pilus assembly protein PilF
MDHRACVSILLLIASTGFGCASTTTTEAARPEMGKAEAISLRKELVYSLASHGEWAAAVQPLLELSEQRPNDADVRTLLGTAYREQGLFEQAAASYQEAIRLDPRNAKAYGGRGILREVSGDKSDAALDDFRAAIRLSPREAAYSNNLGFALCVRGRYKEAAEALQEGLRHDPLSRRMRNNLGFIFGRLGEYDRARREFQHGGTADEVENNLGYVYEQAGDMTEACAHYRRALVHNPLLPAASDNVQRACIKGTSSEGRTP